LIHAQNIGKLSIAIIYKTCTIIVEAITKLFLRIEENLRILK